MTPTILDWYRVDPMPRIVRVLAIAAPALLAGCLLVAFAWLAKRPLEWRIPAGIVGALLNVGAPLYAIFGLRRVLDVDEYVALRTDGLELHLGGIIELVEWDRIVEARYDDERGCVEIELSDDEAVLLAPQLHGVTLRELSKRIEHTRRKIALGLQAR